MVFILSELSREMKVTEVYVHQANKIGDKGAIALGEMIKTNTGLKILHLCGILMSQIKIVLFLDKKTFWSSNRKQCR